MKKFVFKDEELPFDIGCVKATDKTDNNDGGIFELVYMGSHDFNYTVTSQGGNPINLEITVYGKVKPWPKTMTTSMAFG